MHDLKLLEAHFRCLQNPLSHLASGPGQASPCWPSFLCVRKARQQPAPTLWANDGPNSEGRSKHRDKAVIALVVQDSLELVFPNPVDRVFK